MDAPPLEVLIAERLLQQGRRLALAESCTGGLISHRITNVPGASAYYLGSVTAYANAVKQHVLGVCARTLEQYGAVSRETVLEMARGVRRLLHADIGVAISGVAGPGGGSADKPVGLTWIALSAADHEAAAHHVWPGDRLAVKEQSATAALQMLADYLSAGAFLTDQPSATPGG